MSLSRRSFMQRTGGALIALRMLPALGIAAATEGCAFMSDLEIWAPIGLASINSILALLYPGGNIPASILIDALKAALADIPADIAAYNAAPNATTLARIDTTLSLIISNFQQFLSMESVNNPLIALVTGLANIFLAALSGFIMKYFPAPAALPKTKKAIAFQVRVGGVMPLSYTPTVMTSLQYKEKWNALAGAEGHPEAEQHIGWREHLHLVK